MGKKNKLYTHKTGVSMHEGLALVIQEGGVEP